MKTLREYIDILDEISRRDFLKGAGAGAIAGALGSQALQSTNKQNQLPLTEQAYYLIGMATKITAFAGENAELDRYNKLTKKAQSEARINLESLPPSQSKVLRNAYDRGWDAGQEIINHAMKGLDKEGFSNRKIDHYIGRGESPIGAEIALYTKNYMEKLITLLNN
jgi:hypothetical protein